MIQSRYKNRVWFVGLAALFLVLTLFVMFSEEAHDWKNIQATYWDEYTQLVDGNIQNALSANDQDAEKKWMSIKNDLMRSKSIGIKQVFIPEADRRDLCGTCHMGMENALFQEAKNPLKAHPVEILRKHKINGYGCTMCHFGQGIALEKDKAHGIEHNWEEMRLPNKYVQASCFGCHENVYGLKGAEKAALGKTLFTEHGCYGCHDANVIADLPYLSTPLNGIARKIKDEKYIYNWIDSPEEMRPDTLMPTFRLTDQEKRNLTSFVYGLQEEKKLDIPQLKKGVSALGKNLFTDKGCIACHSDVRTEPSLKRRVPKIADAGNKLSEEWLLAWIASPVTVNPETAMPTVELTDNETADIAAFVYSLKDNVVEERIASEFSPGEPEEGKKLVQSIGCYGCHKIKGMENQSVVGVEVGSVAKKRMEELPFGFSDVNHTKWDWIFNKIKKPEIYLTEDMPLKMPNYRLADNDIEALTTFYLNNRLYDLNETFIVENTPKHRTKEKGDYIVEQYNCKGCHEIFNTETPRIAKYLSLKTMIPPRIVNEVERVQPQWLFQYINRPFAMRPWMKIRMPLFNIDYEGKNTLIGYLHSVLPEEKKATNEVPYEPKLARADYDDESIQMGEYRVVTDKCMQCHPVSLDGGLPEGQKLEDLSINLMLAKDRLRSEWIVNFMRNPDQYAGKDTKMPFVFYTPDQVPRIPDPEMWLNYTTLYLMFMEKVPEMKAEEENAREDADMDWTNY